MKKLLSILSSLGLIVVAGTSVVACDNTSGNENHIGTTEKQNLEQIIKITNFKFTLTYGQQDDGTMPSVSIWEKLTAENPLIINNSHTYDLKQSEEDPYVAILNTTSENNLYNGSVRLTWTFAPYEPLDIPDNFTIDEIYYYDVEVANDLLIKWIQECTIDSDFNKHLQTEDYYINGTSATYSYTGTQSGDNFYNSKNEGGGTINISFKTMKRIDLIALPSTFLTVKSADIINEESYKSIINGLGLDSNFLDQKGGVEIVQTDSEDIDLRTFTIETKDDTKLYKGSNTVTVQSGTVSLSALGITGGDLGVYAGLPGDDDGNFVPDKDIIPTEASMVKAAIDAAKKILTEDKYKFIDFEPESRSETWTISDSDKKNYKILSITFNANAKKGYTGSVQYIYKTANLSPINTVISEYKNARLSSNGGYLASSIGSNFEDAIGKVQALLANFELVKDKENPKPKFAVFNGAEDTMYKGLTFVIDNDDK